MSVGTGSATGQGWLTYVDPSGYTIIRLLVHSTLNTRQIGGVATPVWRDKILTMRTRTETKDRSLSGAVLAFLAHLEPPIRLDPWQRQTIRRLYAEPLAPDFLATPRKRGGAQW